MSIRSSGGVTDIPVRVLKAARLQLATILKEIFDLAVSTDEIPDEWKFAVITPLYKNKDDKDDLNNSRGIAVLPPIAKVFERLIAKQIRANFQVNGLLVINNMNLDLVTLAKLRFMNW